MNIAVILVHNKTDAENNRQIDELKQLTKGVEVEISEYTAYHYEFVDFDFPHEIHFYQIVPYGVTPPKNFYDLDSHNVIYRKGDEDKVGDHPRFFNWGLKRGTDFGAEVTVHIDDYKKLDLESLKAHINTVADPFNEYEYMDDASHKVASLKLLKQMGQLEEKDVERVEVAELKNTLVRKGLLYV